MKIISSILFFLTATICSAQVTDNFSDGNFNSNPPWNGDTSDFIVNGSQQLQLNASTAGSSYLVTSGNATSLDSTEWLFYIHLNFALSSGNYSRIYLASDQQNLQGALNGYYLQFGESGINDAIELFRQTGTASTSVVRGTNAFIASAFTITVKITRDSAGLWSIYADPAAGINYVLQATGTDTTYNSSAWFGVACTYTITNAANFYFDDFAWPYVPDIIAPELFNATPVSSTQLDVKFSESVEQSSAEAITNYFVDNGIGNPSSASRDISDNSLVHLAFSSAFVSPTTYSVIVDSVQDLSSNMMAQDTASFLYAIPSAGDIIINEILYNPRTGGYDFVELYNRSLTAIDLSMLRIASGDLGTFVLDDIEIISAQSMFILPGQYLVLTEEPSIVMQEYYCPYPANIIQVGNLPSYNIDFDLAGIVDTNLAVIDKLVYYDSWQFPLLNDSKGISLERINPDKPTQDSTNWHSAAESVGFATPGYRNSQFSETSGDGSEISITPEIFSPDNDGHNDVVNIHYQFNEPGYVASVTLFDSRGRHVRNLIKNELLGTSGSFTWDGVNDKREKSTIGIYIVFVELFKLDGTVKSFKKTCVLASRL